MVFKMKDKSVAVVIPCYNEAGRLNSEAFTGFMQDHPQVKFIFVDDGSSDNTSEILNSQDHIQLIVELFT